MAFSFGLRSRLALRGIHPDLRKLADLAIKYSEVDFRITEGLRTSKRQQELFNLGATRTLNSRHLTGHAVDVVALVGGKVSYNYDLYKKINAAFDKASKELKIPYRWGGTFKKLVDGPHFELDAKVYK